MTRRVPVTISAAEWRAGLEAAKARVGGPDMEELFGPVRSRSAGQQSRAPERKGKYKGVYYREKSGHWEAKIQANRRQVHIGAYLTEEEAARAYDAAAVKIWGPSARVNFPGE